MFWFYVFPMLFCLISTVSFVFHEWRRKGYCEGDDLGMIAMSFLPLLNWFLVFILCWSVWMVVFSKKERYFVRGK